MIVDANAPEAKEDIKNLTQKIKDLDQTPEQMDLWLTMNLGTETFGAWLAIEEDEPVGVLTAELQTNPMFPAFVLIQGVYVDPEYPTVCQELVDAVSKWAGKNKVEKLYFATRRKPKGFTRKYGFEQERILLSKVVKNDRQMVSEKS